MDMENTNLIHVNLYCLVNRSSMSNEVKWAGFSRIWTENAGHNLFRIIGNSETI